MVYGQFAGFGGDLLTELPSRRQDHRQRAFDFLVNSFKDRNYESRGFPGTRVSLTDSILAREDHREKLSLNRAGCLVARGFNGRHHDGAESELLEALFLARYILFQRISIFLIQ